MLSYIIIIGIGVIISSPWNESSSMFHKMTTPLLATALALTLTLHAKAAEVDLKVGVLHFPPFYVVEGPGHVSGIYTDIIEKVLNRAGFTYSIDGFPPKRFYKQLGENTTNFFLGVRGSEYIEGKVAFGELEFEGIQLRAYSTGDTPVVTQKEELSGKRVIVIRGFGYGGLAKYLHEPLHEINIIETGDHYTAFKMLAAGRGDYLLDYRTTSTLVIDDLGLSGIRYGVMMQAHTYFIINKNYPNYSEVLSKIEQAYLELVKEGQVPDIRVNKRSQ